jgi:hypothetical protein
MRRNPVKKWKLWPATLSLSKMAVFQPYQFLQHLKRLLHSFDSRHAAGGEDENEIWGDQDATDGIADDQWDERHVPEYNFVYRQAVQTTDTYLGMDPLGKDPTSTSCEDLILEIHLPEATRAADIDVDLHDQTIMLQTSVQCDAS